MPKTQDPAQLRITLPLRALAFFLDIGLFAGLGAALVGARQKRLTSPRFSLPRLAVGVRRRRELVRRQARLAARADQLGQRDRRREPLVRRRAAWARTLQVRARGTHPRTKEFERRSSAHLTTGNARAAVASGEGGRTCVDSTQRTRV